MGRALLVTFFTGLAAVAVAQPHGEAPKAADDHAPAARQPARPAPVVSRITAAPQPVAGAGGHGEADAHAAATPPAKRGYVPIGASRRTAAGDHGAADAGHGGSGKPKPLVSGASVVPVKTATVSLDEHAGATGDHGAASSHAPDAKPASASRSDAGPPLHSRKPVRLAEVHGRLAAALAEARKDSGGATAAAGDGSGEHGTSHAPTAGNGASTPRLKLTWPGPRWSLTWPAAGRLPLAWPPLGPPAVSLPLEPR